MDLCAVCVILLKRCMDGLIVKGCAEDRGHGWPCSCSCYGKAIDQLLLLTCCSVHLQLTWRSASITHDLTPSSMRKVMNIQLCSVTLHLVVFTKMYGKYRKRYCVTQNKTKPDWTYISLISLCSHLTFYQRLLLFLEITSVASHLLPTCRLADVSHVNPLCLQSH